METTQEDKDTTQLIYNFLGYHSNSDITILDPRYLVPPSQNVLITGDAVKCVESRSGYRLLGRAAHQSIYGIRSKYDDFVNGVGTKLPIREYQENLSSMGYLVSRLEVYYTNQVTGLGDWHPIYGNTITYPHELCFTEWYDDELVLPSLLWVFGGTKIHQWYGGISPVTALTATTIDVNDDIGQLGFLTTGGTFSVTHGGIRYIFTYTSFTGKQFTGVTPDPTPLIDINDILTQDIVSNSLLQLNQPLTNIPTLDICCTLNNHVVHGSYQTRLQYISCSQAFDVYQEIISVNTILDDMQLDNVSLYNGTTESVYKIQIDSVTPEIEEQSFVGNGSDILNWRTSGYTGAVGVTNNYAVNVVADATITIPIASGIVNGDIIIAPSGAGAKVISHFFFGGGLDLYMVKMITLQPFLTTETVTNQDGDTSGAIVTSRANISIQTTKNGSVVNQDFGWGSMPVNYLSSSVINHLLFDGIRVDITNVNVSLVGDSWKLKIQAGDSDTFKWQKDGGAFTTGVSITTNWQTLSNNVKIKFLNDVGHKLNDFWEIKVVPAIPKPWVDVFSYVTGRIPGQGYIQRLDSPPVMMKVQENSMYINSRSGIITTVQFQLSDDFLHENVIAERLKTDFSNKALRNSLAVNTKNDITFINIENQLISLGRVQNILATPISQVLSYAIKDDFAQAIFVKNEDGNGNSHIDWGDNKLFVCIPGNSLMYMYDDFYDFWQPPMTCNFSYVSIIDGQLVAHSSICDESYILFDSSNDNGFPFTSIVALPYNSNGKRDRLKEVSELFTEAYKTANTNMYAKVELDWGNQKNGPDQRLDPKVFTPSPKAALGHAPFGYHGLGTDKNIKLTKFRNILPWNREFVYEYQIRYYMSDVDGYFKLVSTGVNATLPDQRSVELKQTAKTTPVPYGIGIPGTPKVTPEAGGINVITNPNYWYSGSN